MITTINEPPMRTPNIQRILALGIATLTAILLGSCDTGSYSGGDPIAAPRVHSSADSVGWQACPINEQGVPECPPPPRSYRDLALDVIKNSSTVRRRVHYIMDAVHGAGGTGTARADELAAIGEDNWTDAERTEVEEMVGLSRAAVTRLKCAINGAGANLDFSRLSADSRAWIVEEAIEYHMRSWVAPGSNDPLGNPLPGPSEDGSGVVKEVYPDCADTRLRCRNRADSRFYGRRSAAEADLASGLGIPASIGLAGAIACFNAGRSTSIFGPLVSTSVGLGCLGFAGGAVFFRRRSALLSCDAAIKFAPADRQIECEGCQQAYDQCLINQ